MISYANTWLEGTTSSHIKPQDAHNIMGKFNNRPTKCLGLKPPNQVVFGIDSSIALAS